MTKLDEARVWALGHQAGRVWTMNAPAALANSAAESYGLSEKERSQLEGELRGVAIRAAA